MLARGTMDALDNPVEKRTDNLRKVISSSLAEGKFDLVIESCEEYLLYDNEDELPHLAMFLAKNKVKTIEELSKKKAPFETSREYKELVKYCSEETIDRFLNVIKARGRGKRIAITIISLVLIAIVVACVACILPKYL